MTENVTTGNETMDAQALKLPIYRMDGTETGDKVDLDPRLFGVPRNDHVLYLAVKAEMTNRRQGNSSSKGRSDVSGGGRKPWRQKGRGAARVGTTRSPIWRGGGITFGPKPHDFGMKLPKKVKRLARRVAFSVKALNNGISMIDEIKMDAPKTKKIAEMLSNFDAKGMSVLFLVNGQQPEIVKSCRNIQRVVVRESNTASTVDILRARKVFILKSALEPLVGGLVDE
ncbi:MAG: 50S ribosomal protein L4 [Calditrichaeota bacterium]|jgi:large subunit ribosomal protein L4|nr:50S ribosomal protein L4 [Calditrichota bacterium]MBT7616515.1 50S ribosomal protein L4 [Calditrichota bacterium]MBT7787357.1 50S ribosomal protein L4 [Calditrichota bacterium]